jgi:hypothetical protein
LLPSYRRRFNQQWTPEKYRRFIGIIEQRCGEPPQFRHSETPCFFPSELIDQMARYGREMCEQLLSNPRYMADSRRAVPERWCAPNEDPRPLFVQADFGLDQDRQPRLVEIQGFPSLYAYQLLLAEAYREAYGLDSSLAALPCGVTRAEYDARLREAIIGACDPKHVVLLEIDPWNQKTRHDFLMTERWFGVKTVDITKIQKKGRRLFHDGTPIHRIYNRAIVDELERRRIQLPFDFRDDLDVEWAGHPNWFFRLSKFSLPYIDHPAAPKTRFLCDVDDPQNWVLKPLYSFAGAGVIVGPTREQIAAIPDDQRSGYILQERVDFRPVIDTPAGPTKVEVRIMYLWQDQLRPVNTVVRMGRGAQMGVDHNRAMEWVGASAGFIDGGESA